MNISYKICLVGKSELDASQKCPSGRTKLTKTGSYVICGVQLHKMLLLAAGMAQCPLLLLGTEAWFPWGITVPHCEWSWGDGQHALPAPSQQTGPRAKRANQLLFPKRGSFFKRI